MTKRWPCIAVAMLCCLLAVATSAYGACASSGARITCVCARPGALRLDRDSSWQQIVPVPTGSGPSHPSARRVFQFLRPPVPRYIR